MLSSQTSTLSNRFSSFMIMIDSTQDIASLIKSTSINKLTGLHSLPNEVLDLIIQELTSKLYNHFDLYSYYNFTRTCQLFYNSYRYDAILLLLLHRHSLLLPFYLSNEVKKEKLGFYPFLIQRIFGLDLSELDAVTLECEGSNIIVDRLRHSLATLVASNTGTFDLEIIELKGGKFETNGKRLTDCYDLQNVGRNMNDLSIDRLESTLYHEGAEWWENNRKNTKYLDWNYVVNGRLKMLTPSVLRSRVHCISCKGSRRVESNDDEADYSESYPPK